MAWGDIFPALQSGIVDGAICCTKSATYTIFAKSDVGKYYVQYNSVSELTSYYASEKTWTKLDDAQRSAVQGAFTKASDDFFAYNRANDAEFGKKLEEKGYEILALNGEEQAAMAAWVRENIWPTMADYHRSGYARSADCQLNSPKRTGSAAKASPIRIST